METASGNSLIACHECDLLYRKPPLREGERAKCLRCGPLVALWPDSIFLDFSAAEWLNGAGIGSNSSDKALCLNLRNFNRRLQDNPLHTLGAGRGREGAMIRKMVLGGGKEVGKVKG